MTDHVETTIEIALEASAAILEIYRSADFDVSYKEDESPLTAADMASHHIITQRLTEAFPYPVLSEESPIAYAERKHYTRFWLVDPLDGTKDFVARNDEFTVNIALIENGQPIAGVIAIPATGAVYAAESGKGAFRIADGKRVAIRHPGPRSTLIAAESRFHQAPETKDFCARNGASELLTFGSSLKLCKMAEGVVDVYPRFAPTKEWDTAAGHCILNESNCTLFDAVSGKDLTYNKEGLLNPFFIASSKGLKLK